MSGAFKKKDTVLILYPSGGYGSFLHWCLLYFTDRFPNGSLPFKENGSSHGVHLPMYDSTLRPAINGYLESDRTFPFVRSHGNHSDQTSYINCVIDYFDKIVLLEPDIDTRLLLVNNILTKTTKTKTVFLNEIRKTLGEAFEADSDIVPNWRMRELVSYWYNGYIIHENCYKNIVGDKIIKVPIYGLVNNLQTTLETLFDQLGLTFCRRDQFDSVSQQWLVLQRYKDIDSLCRKIIDSTQQGIEFDWSADQLSIVEEAYIQFELRTVYNLDLKCYNLDIFPTSSLALKELLIHV